MYIIEVDSLPVLNQDEFPPLPDIPVGKSLLCFDTAWRNAEKEFAASCLVTACIYLKIWRTVRAEQFIDCMKANPMISPVSHGVANALWSLAEDGYVEVISFQGVNHFVPTPRLAQTALANPANLRVV